jgi:hypothetical protein
VEKVDHLADRAEARADAAPFFIVGSERSGTTMLRLMLNRHSRLCVPPESHFITRLYDRFGTPPSRERSRARSPPTTVFASGACRSRR